MGISSLVNRLRRLRFAFRVNSRIADRFWAAELLRFNVDPSKMSWSRADHALYISDFGIRLFKPEHNFFLKGIGFANALRDTANARFENVENLIVIRLDDVSFEVRTFEELFILHEIFVEGVYNFKLPASAVVVDVGANVGFSSVLFAQDPSVTRVISFEPMETTYQHALRNFSINEKYASKIEPRNYGLSDTTETIEIEFSDEIKGSVGVRGLAHRDDIDRSQIRTAKLRLVDAGSAIGEILDESNRTPVFLKIDCEGSEYRIVDDMLRKGRLTEVAGIMMEWHDPSLLSDLETKLTSAGFTVFSLSPNSKDVGMIYAANAAKLSV